MSINNSFNFGTFNAGTDYKDYRQLILAGKTPDEKQEILTTTGNKDIEIAVVKPESENKSSDVEAHIQNVWEKFSEETAKNLGQVLDVISLQEVKEGGKPRKDIQALKEMGFEIFRFSSEKLFCETKNRFRKHLNLLSQQVL